MLFSSGMVPLATVLPLFITTTRRHIRSAMSSMCVERSTVPPQFAKFTSMSWSTLLDFGSSPFIGSSISSIFGYLMKADAKESFCCMPRE